MNTQGWLRAVMAKNMELDIFMSHVIDCIGREFEVDTEIFTIGEFIFLKIGEYETIIVRNEAKTAKDNGAYSLDKLILQRLKDEGFDFDDNRSQYIRYCYGIYN